MPGRELLFRVRESDIQQLLFADNSDDDDENLLLDDEDESFLLQEVDDVAKEVIIEHPGLSCETSTTTNPVSETEAVRPVTFYSKSKRRCTTKIPGLLSGTKQLVQPESTQSSSKVSRK